jgi:hypothetical protein
MQYVNKKNECELIHPMQVCIYIAKLKKNVKYYKLLNQQHIRELKRAKEKKQQLMKQVTIIKDIMHRKNRIIKDSKAEISWHEKNKIPVMTKGSTILKKEGGK